MKNKSLALIAATVLATISSASAQVLVDYNFNSLTVNSTLAGQDGWVNLSSASNNGPVVRSVTPTSLSAQQGSGWDLGGVGAASRAYRDFGDFNLTTSFTVTLEFDLVRVGTNAQAMVGIGAAASTPTLLLPATVGSFSTNGWNIRPVAEGTVVSAVDSLGAAILPVQSNLYRVQSVWDLSAATATLAVKNLSAGETSFTTLYFNTAQTQSTVSLGTLGDVTLWDDLLIRTGGNTAAGGGFVDNIYVTAIPEPSSAALLLGGAAASLALMARRRRKA